MIHIAVLAHNEEAAIADNLASILAQDGLEADDRITVLENGSTDRTAAIVQKVAAERPMLSLRQISLGDKANAWNVHVFGPDGADGAQAYIFMDGDVTMRPGSVAAIRATFAANPTALAVSGLPHGGRTAEAWRTRILTHHGLPGNLYALAADTVARIRAEGWCLPVGYIGDDTFLLWLLKRRLDPMAPPDRSAIIPAPAARFGYESIPRTSIAGIRQLYRRQRTYALRDLQTKLLIDHLQADPAARPPRDIAELYPAARPWTLLHGPFGSLTPFKLRKAMCLGAWRRTRRPAMRGAPAWYEA